MLRERKGPALDILFGQKGDPLSGSSDIEKLDKALIFLLVYVKSAYFHLQRLLLTLQKQFEPYRSVCAVQTALHHLAYSFEFVFDKQGQPFGQSPLFDPPHPLPLL